MPYLLRQVLVGLAVVLAQWLVFNHLTLWGAYANVVLLFVALQAVRYGRITGTVTGFGTGLLIDLLTTGTPLGLFMLLGTLMGFMIGFFRSELGENLRLEPLQAFLGALLVAVVHNGLMVIILALDNQTRTTFLITGLWFGSALYTAVVALIASLYKPR
ncbi:MAG: rod shape-determining protein MreD [Rubricoccaceae bacterium]|nr:rod shape-determining protein MreD [Rubricoccaceae bacterium]